MNTGTDHDPLDADEAELAKRLHALPGGLPGPELDARIRARAHAAVAARRRPVRPWLWGLSSAAVAVLAVGLFWKAGLPPDGLDREDGAPAAASAPQPAPQSTAEMHFEEAPARTDAAHKAQAAPAQRDDGRPVAAPAAEPAAPPPADAGRADGFAPAPPPPAPPAPSARRPLPEPERRLRSPASAVAPTTAPEREAAEAVLYDLAGERAGAEPGTDSLAASIAEHARGDAGDWLAHIASLLEAGQRDAAIAHLRAFRDAHPDHALPDALRALLDEED